MPSFKSYRLMTVTLAAAAVAIAASALSAGTDESPAPAPSPVAVQIKDFRFVPDVVTIKPGQSIVWTNRDIAAHTATAKDHKWDTGNLDQNKSSKPIAFSDVGSFDYLCSYHPTMKARVIVSTADAPTLTPTPQTTPAPAVTYNSGY